MNLYKFFDTNNRPWMETIFTDGGLSKFVNRREGKGGDHGGGGRIIENLQ